MATERLRIERGIRIVNGRAYGPGTHEIKDKDIARQLRSKGALRVVDTGSGEKLVNAARPETVDELTGPIHEKFPYHQKLADNGVTTFEQLVAKTRDDLMQMEGIAEVSADRILAGLDDELEARREDAQ